MEIYLIRHTLPDIAPGICYGHSDIGVTANFPGDLATVKNKLAGIRPATCFTSPSLRCFRLAEALSLGVAIQDARLKELDFGDWELSSWDDIPRDAFDHWANDYVNQAPPNGETFQQLHQRATEFLQEVNANSRDAVVVVTHAGVIRALLAEALGLPLVNSFRIRVDYGSVTQLLVDEQGMHVGYVNR